MKKVHKTVLLGAAVAFGLTAFGSVSRVAAQSQDGFLFKRPSITLSLRGGYAVPDGGSEIFDFMQEQLTVERHDFNSMTFSGEVAVRVTERVDVAIGLGLAQSITRSEFRDWVGDDDLPIEQSTELTRVPLTASVKYYLKDKGRSVSQLAWIPARWAPYLGVGGGAVFYDFEQVGEFVDFETFEIFQDVLISDGETGTVHVLGGADFSLSPRVLMTAEGRYSWASAEMSQDFSGFDNMDLSGFQASVGFAVRF